jgi:WD40 repeat protein
MNTDNTRPNPYVGPRAFQTGEKLYGRDREVRELLDLLIAERIVLLHSPSGAGKSSLVQAGLYPRLKEKRFSILPIVRVNHEPPAALKGLDSFNRYTFSVLLSFETSLEPDHRTPLEELASVTLEEYLKKNPDLHLHDSSGDNPEEDGFSQGVHSQVLIFDQFEEVLTADSTDYNAKAAFFNQLGSMLRERSRWVLFSMREDYLPALDPYLKPIPTRLANTYRLDFLGVEAAHQAIRKPAGECGVDFTIPAVSKLVNDLRQVQVQQADGSMELRLGPYVEPVQLQVVCYNLWQHIKKDQIQITEEDISAVGTVDESLAEYYADQTALVSIQAGVSERLIREWFDNQLITESGIRGQVLKEKGESSGGLSNDAIRLLVDSHLVRAEKRLNADWYELAHDRLIQPVRKNNARWFHDHLSLLQRQATLWEQQNRSDTLYLRDAALEEAETWANQNGGDLSPVDKEFLEKCLELRAVEQAAFEAAERERQLKLEAAQQLAEAEKRRAEEQAKSAARLRRRAFILAGVLVIAIVMAVVAFFQYGNAQSASIRAVNNLKTADANAATAQAASTLAVNNAQIASTNAVAAQVARDQAAENERIAQTKAAEAVAAQNIAMTQQAIAVLNAEEAKKNAEEALTQANLARSRELASLGLTFLKQNTDLSLLLSMEALKRSNTGQALDVLLRGLQRSLIRSSKKYDQPIRPQTADIHSLVASPDGKQLVWGGSDGLIWAWDLEKQALAWAGPQTERGTIVKALAYHPGGELFAAGYDNGQLTIRNRSDGRKKIGIPTSLLEINSLAYSPDGSKLAFGGKSQRGSPNLFIYDMQKNGWKEFRIRSGETADVFDLAWSPDGKLLASGGPDRMVHIWDTESEREIRTLKSVLRDKVSSPVFEGPIHSLAFSPNGKWLATGGEDNKNPGKDKTLLVWDTTQWNDLGADQQTFQEAYQEPVVLTGGPRYDLTTLAFSPDGGTLATAYENGDILTWNFNSQSVNETIKEHSREVRGLDFSQFGDALLLVSTGLDRSIAMNNLIQLKELDDPFRKDKGNPVRLAAGQEDALTIAGTSDESVTIWDVNTTSNEETPQDTGLQNPEGKFYISPDGTRLAYVAGENEVVVQVITSGDTISITVPQIITQTKDISGIITQVVTGTAVIDTLAINQDGSILAGGMCTVYQTSTDAEGNRVNACTQNEIALWEVSTGNLIKRIPTGQSSQILGLAFNPKDPNSIAAGFQDGTIRLWDIDQARMNGLPMVGLGGPVTSLAYHGDGDILASGSANALIALWNLYPPQLIGDPISGADGAVTGLAFSPNTSILFRGTDKGTVTRLDIESWKQLGCGIAKRNLTRAEWEQFFSQNEYSATCKDFPLETPAPMPTATLTGAAAPTTPTPPGASAPAPTPTPTPTP